jgi:hypothetical protein
MEIVTPLTSIFILCYHYSVKIFTNVDNIFISMLQSNENSKESARDHNLKRQIVFEP